MPLQNYIDKVGPVVSAAWLNAVDVIKFTIFADAATKAAARTALTLDAALEIANGGTGVRALQALKQAIGEELCTVGGTANSITLAPLIAPTSYFTGQRLRFIAGGTNTAPVVVNVSSLGSRDLTKKGSIVLLSGDVLVNSLNTIVYDGTRFQLESAMSAAQLLALLLTVDGTGSGLDADFLRGLTPTNLGLVTNSQSAPNGSGMLAGDTIRVSKNADTPRSSVATSSADPDLQVTNLPTGHYMIAAFLRFTYGAGGSRFSLNSSSSYFITGVNFANAVATAFGCAGGTAEVESSAGVENNASFQGRTNKALTANTPIEIRWAQLASNAAATVLESDSWLEVTRIN